METWAAGVSFIVLLLKGGGIGEHGIRIEKEANSFV